MHDLARRFELDVQKGGGSEGSPTIAKNNALMSASSKFRNFCIKMTLPIVEQVTFLPWWLQSRASNPCQEALQKNVAKEKKCCCWLWLLNVSFEHIWIKEVNYHLIWAWNHISDLRILRWFHLFINVSSQIFAEFTFIMVQYVESR